VIVRDRIYIDGAWVPSTATGTIPVVNSSTEETMGTIPDGTAEDVGGAAGVSCACSGSPR
jgi:acyl-CoA reductase-like NAD-dependent aldehyde dehydrogenase